MFLDIGGIWKADISDGKEYQIKLPGTLDESKIGHQDFGKDGEALIATRFTRKHTYEGEARFRRKISLKALLKEQGWEREEVEGKRLFLEIERARCLCLLVDGKEVPHFMPPSLSTPHVFEVTQMITDEHEITLLSDNSYPNLPREHIVYSSAATDETQTNWNGVLGYLRLRIENPVFLSSIRVYPKNGELTVKLTISAQNIWQGEVRLTSEALEEERQVPVQVPVGETQIVLENLKLSKDSKRWEEEEGNLYELTAELRNAGDGEAGEVKENETKRVSFGVRDFADNGKGKFALNGRTIFIRSEANCAEFPETGHPPMTVSEWEEILLRYRAYGINCMRFHSHCPPKAAFLAADKLGMLMQPELSHWDPKTAFETEESYAYYRTELTQILLEFANHPSFVMITLGNELHASELGHERMKQLVALSHEIDSTRLIANGSNVHYGELGPDEESDFYTSQRYRDLFIRGTMAEMEGYINHEYPGAAHNYDDAMVSMRESYHKPVFSFEVGQFEVLPDFGELKSFQGISDPVNFRLIQEKAREKGFLEEWEKYVEATGELALIAYREEIEAAIRTKELAGISLLGLQDFPGQGTALVGMMNSHLEPKPYAFAKPERFKEFFNEKRILVLLEKYTYENSEVLTADIKVANYGKEDVTGTLCYELKGENVCYKEELTECVCKKGELVLVGNVEIPLSEIVQAKELELTVSIGDIKSSYPIWVYPQAKPKCPKSVYETEYMDDKAKEVLAKGGVVYLSPASTKEALPSSIQAQFTTDFWSVGTFPKQEGGMGQLIDDKHPVFRKFPTKFHTDWQWWPMAVQRAVILPEKYQTIITEMDSYAFLRPMAKLLECRCGKGRLLFSSMGLQNLQQYPEARALLDSIYDYLDSKEFNPKQVIAPEVIEKLTILS